MQNWDMQNCRKTLLKLQRLLQYSANVKTFILSTMLVLSACSRDGDAVIDTSIKVNQPDSFAAYINPIAGLASGDYTIQANVDAAGTVGDFTLTVSYDDGITEEYTGSWSADVATASRLFNITLFTAGGIRIVLESSVDNNLRLLNSNGFVVASNDAALSENSVITLETSKIDSPAYAAAYYAAIDPNNDKDTLEKWKVANGFYEEEASGRVLEPRFRDTKDLGYGRGVRMWTKPDGSLYFFIENFQVRTLPGEEYTSLNLEALLTDDRQHHFGTNAIEFSTFPYGPGEPCAFGSGAACATTNSTPAKFTKFYTFDATQGDQTRADHENEVRLDQVNLDGRGDKAMPGACAYCHGGTLRPLRADGSFRDNSLNGMAGNAINGDVNAKLQMLEVPSFEYGDYSPYTRAEQEPTIKQVNMAIYCTYPNLPAEGVQAACAQFCVDPNNTVDCDGNGNDILTVFGSTTITGQWTGDFAVEMTEGWYDDPDLAGIFDRAVFNEDYVPPAWRSTAPTLANPDPPPPGSEQLFLEVVQPACLVCHSRRGTTLGSNASVGKDIDFSSYQKFISHAEQTKLYVFDYGVMPLSLRGYNAFWSESDDAHEILATHLNAALPAEKKIQFNDENEIVAPGAPIADAGPDRIATSPVRLFGVNSRFVERYSWQIRSAPAGSDAVLTDAATSRPILTTSVDGDYFITLVAAFGTQIVSDEVHIEIDNSLDAVSTPPDPKAITFDNHIRLILSTNQNPANSSESDSESCDGCHQVDGASGAVAGVPVYLLDAQPASGDNAANALYREVLSRVNFQDPENSLILKKPSNNHHYGGLREGFEIDNPANRQNYDMILNWILEGAVEN